MASGMAKTPAVTMEEGPQASKPVNRDQHLSFIAPSMGFLPGQHLDQHVGAVSG